MENYCYECGCPIDKFEYFCDHRCGRMFRDRYGEKSKFILGRLVQRRKREIKKIENICIENQLNG